jgi:UDP-N-acetylmuramate--alanine ligase
LAVLVKKRRGICVAGMHGKTSTTALLAHALQELGADSGHAVGAMVPQLERHARMGCEGGFMVAEADESDGTLREFFPEQAIVLNIDEEHLDFYSNFAAVCGEFTAFAEQTEGTIFFCADDPRLVELYAARADTVTYGFNPAAEYRAELQVGGPFNVHHDGRMVGEFCIRQFGEKNISNAVAVIAFLHRNGFAPDFIARALETFEGANRRQQMLFADDDIRIFDDYGHHPCEIRATLSALRENFGSRLLVAFQPHRYTRTQHLLNEFAECFEEADLLWITEVYAASEQPIPEVNGQALATAVAATGQPAAYSATLDRLREKVRLALQPGDVVLFLGAGDITRVAHQLALDLKMKRTTHTQALQELLSAESEIRENEPLAPRTTLRVGGPADWFVQPAIEADLGAVVRYASQQGLPVFLLGRGANLVIRDGGIRGIVISLRQELLSEIKVNGTELHCGAGAGLKQIANAARDHALSGLEFLEGIPGCLGGALRMNAGSMGSWTFDVVQRVRFMNQDGSIKENTAAEMEAGYRNCTLLKKNIALGAVLKGQPAEIEYVRARMEEFRQHRTSTQPNASSAGCMFKNPESIPAGKLVDECGLKGLTVGGARVSKRHGNFIINTGKATAADVEALIAQVRERVAEQRGIELQTEVQIVGE